MDLIVFDEVIEIEDRYLHKFQRKSGCDIVNNLTVTRINPGEYLRVSTLKRVAIAAGRVLSINKTTITMSLER